MWLLPCRSRLVRRLFLAASLTALLGSTWTVAGQPPALRVQHLTARDGLSQVAVQSLHVDSIGFLWAGTQGGLNRWTGEGFEVFEHDPDDPFSIAHSHVLDLEEDAEGRLWVGTFQGLDVYDPALGHFEHASRDPGSPTAGAVRALALDAAGRLWVGADGEGLAWIEPGAEQPARPRVVELVAHARGVRALLVEGSRLWIGTRSGLFRLPLDGDLAASSVESIDLPGSPRLVHALVHDGEHLWIGTDQGLVRHDVTSGAEHLYRHDPEDLSSLASDGIRCLEILDGRLWIGTDRGLHLYDARRDRFVRYQSHPEDPWSLASNQILALHAGPGSLLFIGTLDSGLDRFDTRAWQLGPILPTGAPGSLPSAPVTSFAEDPAGDVFVGTMGGGLARWKRDRGRFEVYRHDPADPESLPEDQVMTLLVDRRGDLWIGTRKAGLGHLPRGSQTFRRYPHDPDDPRSLAADGVVSLYEDSRGTLWIGTYRGGLDRFDAERRVFEHFPPDPASPTGLAGDTVHAMVEDELGDFWIATFSGLHLFDRLDGTFRRFVKNADDSTSLPSNALTTLAITPDGGLWIGTYGAGLARLESAATEAVPRFRNWTHREGLPDNNVHGIRSDARGRLWLATDSGLARFDPDAEEWKHFTVRHGLATRELMFGAHYGGSDGELFFGGLLGFNAFDPATIDFSSSPPPVALAGLELGNREVPGAATTRRLALTHRDRSVTFEFAALDFVAPEENHYAYKLEGFDETWIETTRRRATYTNLDAGEYTFRVRATSADGATNEDGLAIHLAVAPAPWNTWWARGLYFLVGLGLLSLGVRWRLAGLERRSTELEALVARRTGELSETVERLRVSESAAVEARRRALRSLEEALQERRKAQNASQAKSQFLSSMSHELRTPLNAILGFAQLMERDTDLRPEHRESLSIILRGGEHLLGLVNDVLSLSKIEAGKLALIEEPFDPRRVLCDLEALVRGRAEAKGLELGVEIGPKLPPALHGDAGRLQQVLLNLLGNAVKFTDRGRIDLRLGYRDEVAVFEVADTGRGIDPAERERLFEPFAQTGAASDEGTGLGLAISQELVRLMGGDLEVESTPGEGSTFRFTVPLRPADPEQVPMPRGRVVSVIAEGAPPKILAVDDAQENRRLLERLLERVGFTVRSAGDGREAVEIWRQWRPALVLMDIRMPGVDGYEATRRIRRLEAEEGLEPTVIVALTATAFEHDRRTILEAGCDDVVTKPFRDTQLFETLAEHLEIRFRHAEVEREEEPRARSRTSASPASAQHAEAKSPAKRILVAEDNSANQMVARRMLERLGHDVEVVANGLDAVAAFERDPVDLVLMDVRMPGIDGLEATRRIRASRTARRQPAIVALTGLASDDERQLCYTAGMDDVLAKPFRLDDLRAAVERWLRAGPRERFHETVDDPETEPIRVDRQKLDALAPGSPETARASGSPIDLGKLDQLRQLDDGTAKPLAGQIISLYLDTVPDQLDELRRAVVEGNRHRWRRLAHSLKNSSATLGADGVSAACKELEALGRQVDTDGVLRSRALAVLERLVAELRRALDTLEIERRRAEDG